MVSRLDPKDLADQCFQALRFIGKSTLSETLSCDSVIDGAFFPQPDLQVPEKKCASMHVSIW